MNSSKSPLVVVGAGYVGLVTAVGLAQARTVRLVDKKPTVLELLGRGEMPISEPGLKDRFDAVRDRIELCPRLEDALSDGKVELVFIAVGTPLQEQDPTDHSEQASMRLDLSGVEDVVNTLMGYSGLTAVMKSTVPPGTGRAMVRRIRSHGSDLAYLSCPEFLQEGKAFKGVDRPDRVIVGADDHADADGLHELHRELHPDLDVGAPRYLKMKVAEAELVKQLSNVHLAMRISFANQAGNICEEIGADVHRVIEGVGADRRIGPNFMEVGLGFGGSCFSKDARALQSTARDFGLEMPLVTDVLAANDEQLSRAIAKLKRRMPSLKGVQIALLGLAFKRGTDDVRESPALALAELLRDQGASVRGWDPHTGARRRVIENSEREASSDWMADEEVAASALEAMTGADAVVIATAWPQFEQIDWDRAAGAMAGTLVIDGRNQLSADAVRSAGLEYEGTGRESSGLGQLLV